MVIKVAKTVTEIAKQIQRNEKLKYRYQSFSPNGKLSCDVPKRGYYSENSYYCSTFEAEKALKLVKPALSRFSLKLPFR